MKVAEVVLITALVGCSGGGGGGEVVTIPPSEPERAHGIAPKSRVDELARALVYDASGNAASCGPPQKDCPPLPVERDFLDKCRLGGFQVRQCGCAARCSGNVAGAGRHYDAGGNAKDCAPAIRGCDAKPATTAFQDACSEKGYYLDVCGCEWLCSGNPVK